MKFFGQKARLFLEQLAKERDATKGDARFLFNGTVKLDSVKAWDGKDAAVDGSEVEVVYKAYRDPTARQIKEAASAKAAGVDLQCIKGRLVDIKTKDTDGSVLLLVTNGLRGTDGRIPYRAMNVNKGHVYGIAIGESLGTSAEETRTLADGLDAKATSGSAQPAEQVVQPGPTPAEGAPTAVADATPEEAPKVAPWPANETPEEGKSKVVPTPPEQLPTATQIAAELPAQKTATAPATQPAAQSTGNQEELLRVARAAKELIEAIEALAKKAV